MNVLLFFASFLYYLVGLCGTVPAYRDSGDLIASIQTLGIAHPPGYALYVLLGKLFIILVPFGNVAYRVNVMSALFGALTVVLLFKLLRSFFCPGQTDQHSEAFALGKSCIVVVLFATSPAVVTLARVAEMYTLSACLAAGILYSLFSGHKNGSAVAALLLGLGLSVHPTLLFLGPLFFVPSARPLNRRTLLYFAAGLSVFLYLPIRASQHPLLNWGDPSHWRNFWRVVTRADYGGLKLHPEESVFSWTPESIASQVLYFFKTLKGEWGWGGLLVGSVGLFQALRISTSRSWGLPLVISWILSGPAFFILSNLPLAQPTTAAILQPYLLLVSVLWLPFVMTGFQAFSTLRVPSRVPPLLISVLLISTKSWSWSSERYDFYSYDYARNLLRSLPSHAVLYDPDDTTHFSLQALQTTEARRQDVVLLSFFRTRWGYEEIKRRWPDLLPPIPIDSGQMLERVLWEYSARRQPFFAELPQKLGAIPYRSQGLAYAALSGSTLDSRERSEALLSLYVRRGDFVTTHQRDFFTSHVIAYYAAAENNLGIEYTSTGQWEKAAEHYQRALLIEPDQVAAKSNAAFALQKMRKLL